MQNQIVKSTSDPVEESFQAIADWISNLIDAGAMMDVNMLYLQEAWAMPFAFCTRERQPWLEFAESVEDPSTMLLSKRAQKHNMVSPILECDEAPGGTIHNTAVGIGNRGNMISSHRKLHPSGWRRQRINQLYGG